MRTNTAQNFQNMITPIVNNNHSLELTYTPSMYLWVSFKIGGTKVFYSRELRNSFKQIAHRGALPHIDFHFGLQSLENLAENVLIGQFNNAIIYGLKNDNKESGIELIKYNGNGGKEIVKKPNFNAPIWQEIKDRRIQKIQEMCAKATKITLVFDPQNPIILRK